MNVSRFKIIRQNRRARGLCDRCGAEKAKPGSHIGILCESEIKAKKIVAPARRVRCEKIARLERNLVFVREAEKALVERLTVLRAG